MAGYCKLRGDYKIDKCELLPQVNYLIFLK
jgi:hypothetical protein